MADSDFYHFYILFRFFSFIFVRFLLLILVFLSIYFFSIFFLVFFGYHFVADLDFYISPFLHFFFTDLSFIFTVYFLVLCYIFLCFINYFSIYILVLSSSSLGIVLCQTLELSSPESPPPTFLCLSSISIITAYSPPFSHVLSPYSSAGSSYHAHLPLL